MIEAFKKEEKLRYYTVYMSNDEETELLFHESMLKDIKDEGRWYPWSTANTQELMGKTKKLIEEKCFICE